MQLDYVVKEYVRRMSRVQIINMDSGCAALGISPPPDSTLEAYLCLISEMTDGAYELIIPSKYNVFENEDIIPQWLAVYFLKENTKKAKGFWCILDNLPIYETKRAVVCQMWNVSFIEFTPEELGRVIESLLISVGMADETVKKLYQENQKGKAN